MHRVSAVVVECALFINESVFGTQSIPASVQDTSVGLSKRFVALASREHGVKRRGERLMSKHFAA